MATRTIATRLALEGESEYKAKLKNINAELSLHKSELEKVQAQYEGSANSLEALSAKQSALQGQMKALDKRHEAQADMLKKAQEAQQRFADQAEELRQKLEALQSSSEDTAEEEKKLAKELDQAELSMQKAANSATFYQKQLNDTERDQAKLGAELEQTGQYLEEAASSADHCAQSIDGYGKEVKDAGESSQEFGDASKEAINQLAAALAAAGVAKTVKEIADELWDCSKSSAAVETAWAKLSTLMVPHSMEPIKNQLMELSDETGIAIGALAEAAYQARSAGIDAANVVDFVTTATKTSIAGFTDSAAAVNVLTTAINAYKLEGSEAEKVASMLIKTQDEGKTSVNELAQNMGRVIPVAAAYNVSLGNLTTAYALLTKSGTNTAIATTNLSAMLTELADNGSNVAGILQQQTGQSFSQLMDGGSNLGEIMAVLSDSVGGNATAFSNLWSSTTAGQAALSLLNSGADEFTRTLGVIETSSGAVEKNFQAMADTTEFAKLRMDNAIQNLRIAIGDQLNPALEKLYIFGTDAFTWATDFVEDNPWVVGTISGLTAALGALAIGVGALTAAPAILGALKTALAVLAANPVVAVAVAVAGVVTAVEACTATTSEAGRQNKAFVKSLQETKDAYEDLKASMGQQQATAKATASSLKELLAVEGKSAAQKEEILRKVDQLNEAVPELGLAYDREKDALIGLTEAELDEALARAAAAEEHEAQMDRLNELSSQRVELEAKLAEARQALTEAEGEGARGVDVLQLTVDAYTAALKENKAEYDALSDSANAYAEHQGEAQRRQEEMTEKVDALTAEMAELQDAYDQSVAKARESLESQMGLFQELDGTAKSSIDDLIASLESQAKYMDDYAANLQKAMELGVDEGLVKKLSDGREESAQILDAIVKGGEEEIARLNAEFRKVEQGKTDFETMVGEMEHDFDQKMAQLEGDLDETMKVMELDLPGKMDKVSLALKGALSKLDVSKDMEAIGANNIQGLINGTMSKIGALTQQYTNAAKAAKDAYKKAVDQHSPSKEFEKMGRYDIQGLIQGAEEEKQRLAETYEEAAQAALAGMARHMATATKEAPPQEDTAARQLQAISAATVNAISGIAQTGSAQPFTINLVFPDGSSFASYYFDPLAQYADANGTPILNPVR